MTPVLSIIMPVFNTGWMLLDSVRSVVAQTLWTDEPDGYWELLIVDDGSVDDETHAALKEARAMSPAIRILPNNRSKGVAGARNAGVFAARGEWIGFLDSDDLWYPDFLRRQRDAFGTLPQARWRAAHFDVGDDAARTTPLPLSLRSPCLYRHIQDDYRAGRVAWLRRPVDVLLRCGCMQVMTVQVRRDLIVAVGGYDERLICAEDYDLWLRLANMEDLYLSPLDAGIYRLRSGSLTKSERPTYYWEDRMLLGIKRDRAFAASRPAIDERLRRVYATFCSYYRERGQFRDAVRYAWRLVKLTPFKQDGWRHLAASALHR